jgi:hypothetical protein
LVALDPDHPAARAGHPHVGDVRGAAGEHARIGGRHVGVGAHHGGHPPVEIPAHADLLAGRLGVHVDDHVVDLVLERVQGGVDLGERRPSGVHEQVAAQRDHPQAHVIAGDHAPAVAGLAAQEVGRAQDLRAVVQVGVDLALAVGVVAQRDHVDTGREQLVGQLGRDPDPAGDVLAVGHYERRRMPLAQRRQQAQEGALAQPADHVADEQDLDGPHTPRLCASGIACARR